MIAVFVASPSPSRRESLRRALESDEVRVVGESDAPGAADGIWPAAQVLVVDGETALESIRETDENWPPAVVVLLDRPGRRTIGELRRLGAAGCAALPRDAEAGQLRAAVTAAAAGLASVPLDWEDRPPAGTFDGRRGPGAEDGETIDGWDGDEDDGAAAARETLTAREAEVLEWMARGMSNRQIGLRLGISEHTAKFHVASVLAKLGAHNRADAVRRGVRRGLVAV